MPKNLGLVVGVTVEAQRSLPELEVGLLWAQQFVHQEAANLWQHDHTDAALADQPLDRPSFATRVRQMVAESLAPAWEVGRITANDLFHGF